MSKCDSKICKDCGLIFDKKYSPFEFIEGSPTSPIWIIGLNPKKMNISNLSESKRKIFETIIDKNGSDMRSADDLKNCLLKKDSDLFKKIYGRYYNVFRDVSCEILYKYLGKDHGVAHADIVKCASENFPMGSRSETKSIIGCCSEYLAKQIEVHKPQIIICNGSYVCDAIKEIIIPIKNKEFDTYYSGCLKGENHDITVILSGYIGRIDKFSRRRLGIEIEKIIEDKKINLS